MFKVCFAPHLFEVQHSIYYVVPENILTPHGRFSGWLPHPNLDPSKNYEQIKPQHYLGSSSTTVFWTQPAVSYQLIENPGWWFSKINWKRTVSTSFINIIFINHNWLIWSSVAPQHQGPPPEVAAAAASGPSGGKYRVQYQDRNINSANY